MKSASATLQIGAEYFDSRRKQNCFITDIIDKVVHVTFADGVKETMPRRSATHRLFLFIRDEDYVPTPLDKLFAHILLPTAAQRLQQLQRSQAAAKAKAECIERTSRDQK